MITAQCGLTRPNYIPQQSYFPSRSVSCFANYFSLIVKAIINFSGSCVVVILYLFAKFELDRSTNNGDLLSDRNHWKQRHTTKKDRQTDTHTQTESDTLPIQAVGSSNDDSVKHPMIYWVCVGNRGLVVWCLPKGQHIVLTQSFRKDYKQRSYNSNAYNACIDL